MADYIDDLQSQKKYLPNFVIKIGATYFAKNTPDSGLSISSPYNKMVASCVVNPVSMDIKRVSTEIASYTFRLIDKDNIISNLMNGNGEDFINADVTIYIGRNRKLSTDEANDFAGYLQLPVTKIKKIKHGDNSYTFTTSEDIARINRPIYDASSALGVDILAGTTTIQMRDEITSFPSAGQFRVEDEIISYTSKNDGLKQFLGCSRGQQGTTAAGHSANEIAYHSETLTDNPLNVILKLLISNGGGGTYDTLTDGCGFDPANIDVTEIENLRDTLFSSAEIKLEFSNLASALKTIENEILQFFNLRFTYSLDSKLTLAVLDKSVFTPIVDTITEDSITSYPDWNVDDTKIVNKLKIYWDYDEPTGKYLRFSELTDSTSISNYGLRAPLTFNFKGIKEALDGEDLVTEFARVLFARFSTPVAEVEIKTHIDQQLKTIGSKVYLESTKVPSPTGGLNFASDMEVTKRSINFEQQQVGLTLAFTSFTRIRSAYLAPSDLILHAESQKKIFVANGRSAKYRVGWYMRLWNESTQSYEADSPNKIIGFTTGENTFLLESGGELLLEGGGSLETEGAEGDGIIFENNWSTTLTTNHRIRFAKYDNVEDTQKRYGFISDSGNNFDDGKPSYKVTY